MIKINSIHRLLMRKMLLGRTVEDICLEEGLDVELYKKASETALFKSEMKEMAAQVTTELATETASEMAKMDPMIRKLKGLVPAAVDRIADEMHNFNKDDGATASTRLDAAKTIIAMEGSYSPKKEAGSIAPIININFSPAKLAMVEKRAAIINAYQPAALPAQL